jgi:hypothetical protein
MILQTANLRSSDSELIKYGSEIRNRFDQRLFHLVFFSPRRYFASPFFESLWNQPSPHRLNTKCQNLNKQLKNIHFLSCYFAMSFYLCFHN